MKENFVYVVWAYALIGTLICVYSLSLIRRSRRVIRELEALAAIIRKDRGSDPAGAGETRHR